MRNWHQVDIIEYIWKYHILHKSNCTQQKYSIMDKKLKQPNKTSSTSKQ